jgi:hypothetical protein
VKKRVLQAVAPEPEVAEIRADETFGDVLLRTVQKTGQTSARALESCIWGLT